MARVPAKLRQVADELRAGKSPTAPTVRAFLGWFGAQRRGYYITRDIEAALSELQLTTEPDFRGAFIDAPITIKLAAPDSTAPNGNRPPDEIESPPSEDERVDPTYRIGKLPAANRQPVSVKPNSDLREATTLMLAHDFSQLPVMHNEREVKGLVSWRTIGQRLLLGRPTERVRDCMERHHEIDADASIFSAIDVIVLHEYVLVRDSRINKITGIVTTSDLSLQFGQLAEPFLLLGEIENHVRDLISRRFSPEELAALRDPNDSKRAVRRVADLTYGEYVRLCQSPDTWARLQLPIDRSVFAAKLDRIREIRNDVMHFDPDGIGDADLKTLRDFARFVRSLRALGAI